MITGSTNVGDSCPYCFQGRLTESTTTYANTGSVLYCNRCKRTTYVTLTITPSASLNPDKLDPGEDVIVKKESWFDRDKREKKLLNLRKKRKR